MTVQVRPLADGELGAAIALLAAGSLDPESERLDDIDRYRSAVVALRREGSEILVAVDADEVVGVCELILFTHLQHGGSMCAELESVHVKEGHRSRGVGRAMLVEAERRARVAGCYRIQLTSRVVRGDAHRFYEANGYQSSHVGFKKLLD